MINKNTLLATLVLAPSLVIAHGSCTASLNSTNLLTSPNNPNVENLATEAASVQKMANTAFDCLAPQASQSGGDQAPAPAFSSPAPAVVHTAQRAAAAASPAPALVPQSIPSKTHASNTTTTKHTRNKDWFF